MASLFKKTVYATDAKSGARKPRKSKKWWGRYKTSDGRERRVPLAADKAAAQAMLNELVRNAEREAAGLQDPFEVHRRRPLREHVADFRAFHLNKGDSGKHVGEIVFKVNRIVAASKWKFISDVDAGDVLARLKELRDEGLSIQTSNHHLRAIKQFSRWLVRERRTGNDPLVHLAEQNAKTDRRHDRRPLSHDEFARLLQAAENGPTIEAIPGPDRVMMYVLAAWTGFRKGEIGSLTRRSFRLDDDPPTATVSASYSKRKRKDTQVLHPTVVQRLRNWLDEKDIDDEAPLFPVSGKFPGGKERKTSKMMRKDLARARAAWIKEAEGVEVEVQRRRDSDFLKYQSSDGLFADFHSNRHLFITNMEKAGLSPKMAQTLARHSDIRLTLGVYTHLSVHDQTAAIEAMPAPPNEKESLESEPMTLAATGTDAADMRPTKLPDAKNVAPVLAPKGAENGAAELAPETIEFAPNCNGTTETRATRHRRIRDANSLAEGPNRAESRQDAPVCNDQTGQEEEVHPRGFEPLTFGSVVR